MAEAKGENMNLQKLDIRELNEKAQRFFEASDSNGINDIFGKCKSIDEINEIADELYDEFFGE